MTPRATIEQVMHILRAALAPVVTDAFRSVFGKRYLDNAEKALKSDKYLPRFNDDAALMQIDVTGWLNLIMRRWDEVFKDQLDSKVRSYVGELIQARHDWAHQGDFSDEDTYRIIDTALRLLRAFELSDAIHELTPIRAAWYAHLAAAMDVPLPTAPTAAPLTRGEFNLPPEDALAPPPLQAAPLDIEQGAGGEVALDAQIAVLSARWTRPQLRAEVVRLLHTFPLDDDLPLTVTIAPRRPGDLPPSAAPRLVILAPEHAHARDAARISDSAAFKVAVSAARGVDQTAYLALDLGGAGVVGAAVRRWLALHQIARTSSRGGAPPPATTVAERTRAYDDVDAALQAAYRWLIVMQDGAPTAIELDDAAPLIDPAVRAAAFYLRADRR